MRFHKWHGAGNDFVMLEDWSDALGPAASLDPRLVAALCDRHLGVGADGLIRVALEPDGLRMDYYNADGLPAEMCGNGIRCTVALAHRAGRIATGDHVVLTGAGPRTVVLGQDALVAVDMGEPRVEGERAVDGVDGFVVSMGNPHFVVFTGELSRVLTDGPRLEVHAAFPNRTNVEFVEVASESSVRMRVWERGIGETLACGSGACAAAVAAAALGKTKRELDVHLPGGTLGVAWGEDGHVWLRGPAEEVFWGEVGPAWLEEATARIR